MEEVASLAGGCFWCLEAVFQELEGVIEVESGYMGGSVPHPSYRQVCSGSTGHAEVVRVTFDPQVLSFGDLLDVFFNIHDPTSLNRQGSDVGTQYRSAIFYHSEAQRAAAEAKMKEVQSSGEFHDPLVTELVPAGEFYKAEDYHQNYFLDNPNQPYCAYVVAPKVAKFRKKFPERRKV
ncbi:MAG TPA: peptide-methionine (S)-S-oxide reductase MsrA [Bryobacteraceae bacterium]|jgi:peptide-methionine (S)-S-oxide reductase|nr:peptide-methionine (S)-S-oxide reductase MsrA [Bryobacteraceae bacterium]